MTCKPFAQRRPRRAALSAGQRGFSLLEVLVAFSIMAIALAMLYRASGGSMRSIAHVEHNQRAVMLVESLLAANDNLGEGGWNESGESGGLGWQVQSQRYATPASAAFPDAVPLYEVVITVSWRDGQTPRQIAVKTLRPQRKPLVKEPGR